MAIAAKKMLFEHVYSFLGFKDIANALVAFGPTPPHKTMSKIDAVRAELYIPYSDYQKGEIHFSQIWAQKPEGGTFRDAMAQFPHLRKLVILSNDGVDERNIGEIANGLRDHPHFQDLIIYRKINNAFLHALTFAFRDVPVRKLEIRKLSGGIVFGRTFDQMHVRSLLIRTKKTKNQDHFITLATFNRIRGLKELALINFLITARPRKRLPKLHKLTIESCNLKELPKSLTYLRYKNEETRYVENQDASYAIYNRIFNAGCTKLERVDLELPYFFDIDDETSGNEVGDLRRIKQLNPNLRTINILTLGNGSHPQHKELLKKFTVGIATMRSEFPDLKIYLPAEAKANCPKHIPEAYARVLKVAHNKLDHLNRSKAATSTFRLRRKTKKE